MAVVENIFHYTAVVEDFFHYATCRMSTFLHRCREIPKKIQSILKKYAQIINADPRMTVYFNVAKIYFCN